jgi:glycosyltransferase involved in cell wall biosynthesis
VELGRLTMTNAINAMTASTTPYFSILIASYNRPASIVKCLESVFANQGEDFEVIISDDASPGDAVTEAARPFLAEPNVRFFKQGVNLGEPANRNFLVSQARGRFNIIVCDDDALFPHTLRTLRTSVEDHPDYDLYLFGYRVVDERGRRCYDRVAPQPLSIEVGEPRLLKKMFEATWLSFMIFHQSTYCCRRGLEARLRYRTEVAPADDYMFLLECLNQGKRMYVVPECLMSYRWCLCRDRVSQANQSSDIIRTMAASTTLYYDFQRRHDLHPSVKSIVHQPHFRRRFLYDMIIRRMPLSEGSIESLPLHQGHRHEFEVYRSQTLRSAILIRVALTIMTELLREFGVQGLVYWIRSGIAYVRYRVFNVSKDSRKSEQRLSVDKYRLRQAT